MMSDDNFRLCFVEGGIAYFTTAALEEQWGDDWNDIPYEHNARHPYLFDAKRNVEPYEIKTLAFAGPLVEPCTGYLNSPYSVERINGGAIPWLRAHPFDGEPISIPAGTTIPDFIRLAHAAGAVVYYPLQVGESSVQNVP